MKTSIQKLLKGICLVCCIGLILTACSDEEEGLFDGTDITSVSVPGTDAGNNIDKNNQTITVILPEHTDFSNVKLNINASEGATVSLEETGETIVNGETSLDLTKGVKLIVTAQNSNRAHWVLYADNNGYTSAYGLGKILTDSKSNNAEREVYLEQHNSTTFPNSNCAPSCAAMAINWANPRAQMTVEMARSFNKDIELWTDDIIVQCLASYGTTHAVHDLDLISWSLEVEEITRGYGDLVKKLIDEGKIIIMSMRMQDITYIHDQSVPVPHTNTYYKGAEGNHAIIIKGYRIVDGITWAEVYDPWSQGYTYSDGTYKGKDRYYTISDLALSIKGRYLGSVITVTSKTVTN